MTTPNMKICPKCQQVRCNFQGEVVFCSIDGTKLEDAPRCECGDEIMPHDKFCSKCGKPVEVKTP